MLTMVAMETCHFLIMLNDASLPWLGFLTLKVLGWIICKKTHCGYSRARLDQKSLFDGRTTDSLPWIPLMICHVTSLIQPPAFDIITCPHTTSIGCSAHCFIEKCLRNLFSLWLIRITHFVIATLRIPISQLTRWSQRHDMLLALQPTHTRWSTFGEFVSAGSYCCYTEAMVVLNRQGQGLQILLAITPCTRAVAIRQLIVSLFTVYLPNLRFMFRCLKRKKTFAQS